jgi:hypothetical protein
MLAPSNGNDKVISVLFFRSCEPRQGRVEGSNYFARSRRMDDVVRSHKYQYEESRFSVSED